MRQISAPKKITVIFISASLLTLVKFEIVFFF